MPPTAGLRVCLAVAVIVQAVPPTSELAAAARRYIADYQNAFNLVVADEIARQTVRQPGRRDVTRETRGDFYTIFAEAGRAWMSVHDVTLVDDVPVVDRGDARALLASVPGRELARFNARYNIGPITRNFNEPTLALQLLAADRSADVSFGRARATPAPDGIVPTVELSFRARSETRFIGSPRGRVSVEGTADVEPASGRIHRTQLAISDGAVEAVLDTRYAPEPRLGLLVPVRFTERYRMLRTGETTLVESEYTNYRRFETAARLKPGS